MLLSEIIIKKIHDNGPISFRDFMDMALYYPHLGYYTSTEEKIGKSGDYYTTPYYTSIFGEMIGKQLEEMWQLLDKEPFIIVEYGAGTGVLCRDILNYLKNNKDLYHDLTYCIIEKSEVMREKERAILPEKVSWHQSPEEIPKINGCVLSNELLDNFPVHQVVMEDELMEVFVGFDKGFVELLRPASTKLKEYFEELKVTLPKGFRAEVNLQAIEWISEIAEALNKGFVLTIDYGFSSADLYRPERSLGSIVCYHKHEINENVFDKIGKQDITAHVNFSALVHWGIKKGLDCTGFTNQANFMRTLGLINYLREMEDSGKYDLAKHKEKLMFANTLMLDMGGKFKVLIQHKGVQKPLLSGLQLSKKFV
jgi:SAM-dependent MidA family methyltransferase